MLNTKQQVKHTMKKNKKKQQRDPDIKFEQSVALLHTGSKERGVLWAGSIPVAILSFCQYMKKMALHKHVFCLVVAIRNTSEAVLRP